MWKNFLNWFKGCKNIPEKIVCITDHTPYRGGRYILNPTKRPPQTLRQGCENIGFHRQVEPKTIIIRI